MIFVRRLRCPLSLDLSKPNSAAAKEIQECRIFYDDSANDGKNYGFSAYKHKDVKRQLEGMFHGKCAYCESKYVKVHPVDIEHYRPKGGVVVDGDLMWPGYWWLAAKWTNLLPSCIDCNRRRYHCVPDEDEGVARGKENLFPIYSEEDRAGIEEDSELSERPLLLNPCRHRPETYLSYENEAGRVTPLSHLTGERLKRAESSISVYGLDRGELNSARSDYQLRVIGQADHALNAFKKLKRLPTARARRQALADELRGLQAMSTDDTEYAAVGRSISQPVIGVVQSWLDRHMRGEISSASDGLNWLLDSYPGSDIGPSPLSMFMDRVAKIRAS